MKTVKLGNTNIDVPAIILGCMRMNDKPMDQIKEVIQTAIDNGITFFDHADIYGKGECETIFGNAIKELGIDRNSIWIQSKGSIRPEVTTYDFSKEHILRAVDGSLGRLQTDYLDSYLLHRPDTLVDLKEIAEVFDELYTSGKVRHFGVSNCNAMQIEMLKKHLKQPILIDQLQFGLMHTSMIDSGINVNNYNEGALSRDGSILEYTRIHDITIQAWSPFVYGYFEGIYIDNDKFPKVNEALETLAKKYGVTKLGIATAWVLRHPAGIQMIAGTMTPSRVKEVAAGADVMISREDWYTLYQAAGNLLP